MLFRIDIDDREREAIPLFDVLSGKRQVATMVKRLTTGDFAAWFQDSLKVLFERKTWDDLAASIKDGRIDEQLRAMREVKNKTSCINCLIIEGIPRKQHGHIELQSLRAKLDHIMLADKAHIVYTCDVTHTVERIFEIVDNIPYDLSEVLVGDGDVDPQTAKLLTDVRERGLEQQLLDVFNSVKLISMNTARMLIKNRWNFLDLYEADENMLAGLVYPSGFGMPLSRAKKIVRELGTQNCWINALSNITGITKKTAKIIMDAEPDPYKWTVASISALSKSEKRKIGPQVAQRIMQVLMYKS